MPLITQLQEIGEIPSYHRDVQEHWHIMQSILIGMASIISQWNSPC